MFLSGPQLRAAGLRASELNPSALILVDIAPEEAAGRQ